MIKQAITFALTVGLFASTASSAQDLGKKEKDSKAQKMAMELGTLGGSAQWCKLDKTLVEEFSGWAETQIALASKDDFDKVSSRIRFSDARMIAATKKPPLDCKTVARQIQQKQAASRL